MAFILTPQPEGTITLGEAFDGLVVRSTCRGHVFRVSEPRKVDYGCGWIQSARCLVCDYVTQPIDATWWYRKASQGDLESCLALIDRESDRLGRIRVNLLSEIRGSSQPLRNFG